MATVIRASFLDGPLAGRILDLVRPPLFLRVAHASGRSPEVVALDHLLAQPRPEDTIHVYLRGRPVPSEHESWNARTGVRTWHTEIYVNYSFYAEQPEASVARSRTAWRAWTLAAQAAQAAQARERRRRRNIPNGG